MQGYKGCKTIKKKSQKAFQMCISIDLCTCVILHAV